MPIVVHRFCNANDSTTFLSYAAQQGMSPPSDHWQRRSIHQPTVLKRAYEHMDGKTILSPFVSVATDVLALVKYGGSGGLLDIIYGVDKPERRAPHIVTFRVPEVSVISPETIVAGLPQATGLMGLARSRSETELVYFGNDIKKYQISYIDNPYTNDSFQARIQNEQQTEAQAQRLLEEAEAAKLQAAELANAGKPKSLFMQSVKGKGTEFDAALAGFLRENGNVLKARNVDTAAVSKPSLSDTASPALGPILRRFDEAVLAIDDAPRRAWLVATAAYRK